MDLSNPEKVLQDIQLLNRTMENLLDISMDDDKISESEREILLSINQNIETYAKIVIEALSDGDIDEVEQEEIRILRGKIVADAEKVAFADRIMSTEEKKLIDVLRTALS